MLDKYLLNTYEDVKPEDGLSIVYHRLKPIAPIIEDAEQLKEKSIILVAGIPIFYIDRMSLDHINICYTTYEFTPIPENWVLALNMVYTAVIVPHESIKTMFEKSGVFIPIYVVSQGYTRFLQNSIERKKPDCFTLGFLGVPVKRKNLRLLIQAIEEISNYREIKLKVHVSTYYDWFEDKDLPDYLQNHPLVDYSDGFKSNVELGNWYKSLSAYIFPSSGEGWSFTPRESLSLGIPTIISNIPVHEDLAPFCCMIDNVITVESIKLGILEYINKMDLYQEKAILGQQWVSQNYNDDKECQSISQIMDKYASFEY